MLYIIVDLEATCWEAQTEIKQKEIIEIGAVALNENFEYAKSEFSSFVKPVENSELSDFCKQLTTIKQNDIDNAEDFKDVFRKFLNWIGSNEFTICSWGIYDLNQFNTDCRNHGFALPESFKNHINLKLIFKKVKDVNPGDIQKAMKYLEIKHTGVHHRGIDDARNIAKISQLILPQYLKA